MANSDYWDRRALLRLTDAEKTSIAYEKQIRKYYRKAERDIEKMIDDIYTNYAKDVGLSKEQLKMLLNAKETSDVWKQMKAKGLDKYVKDNYKARINRLEAIKAQLYEKAKDLCRQEQKSLRNALKKVSKDTYYRTVFDTSKATNLDMFTTLDDKTIDTNINMKWHGGNYSDRVWNNTDALASKLQDVMTRSVMTGASLAKAKREIRDTFNTADYYAERLIRTETNHVHNESEALAYQAMGVEEYVFVATLDNRTSEICQDHDQKRYRLSEKRVGENYPPMHPNCRSTVRAFIDEETEKTMVRRARNPLTGETELVGNISYKEWMEKHKRDEENSPFRSVLDEWNKKKEPKKGEISVANQTITKSGDIYRNGQTLPDGKMTKLKKKLGDDRVIGKWFKNNYWGEVEFQREILYPQNIRSADLVFTRKCHLLGEQTLEIKTIEKSKREDGISHRVKSADGQSSNVLVELGNYSYGNSSVLKEVAYCYQNYDWLDTLLIKKEGKLLYAFKRKK